MAIREAIIAAKRTSNLKMSYEEFLAWGDEDTHAEWDAKLGEVVIAMPPRDIHQTTIAFLHRLLGLFADLFNLGKVGIAPFEVKLKPGGSAREPDIFFVTRANLERWIEDKLLGPADLIIEIISPDSVQRDRRDKFREYAEAGVTEYWLVDPRPGKQRADFFRLDTAGQYELYATEDNDRVESQVMPGFWLRPAWLWQVDTLSPLTCALEIEGVAVALEEQIKQSRSSGLGNLE